MEHEGCDTELVVVNRTQIPGRAAAFGPMMYS